MVFIPPLWFCGLPAGVVPHFGLFLADWWPSPANAWQQVEAQRQAQFEQRVREEVARKLLEQQKHEEQRQLEAERQLEARLQAHIEQRVREEVAGQLLKQQEKQQPSSLEQQLRLEQQPPPLAQQPPPLAPQPPPLAPPPLAPPPAPPPGTCPDEERVIALIHAEMRPLHRKTYAAAHAAKVARNLLALVSAGFVVVLAGWPATFAAAASAASQAEPWWGVAAVRARNVNLCPVVVRVLLHWPLAVGALALRAAGSRRCTLELLGLD